MLLPMLLPTPSLPNGRYAKFLSFNMNSTAQLAHAFNKERSSKISLHVYKRVTQAALENQASFCFAGDGNRTGRPKQAQSSIESTCLPCVLQSFGSCTLNS